MGRDSSGEFIRIWFILLILIFFIVYPAPAAGTETLITTQVNGFNHQLPTISDDLIVWQDSDPFNNFGIIYLYNITSGIETQVTDNTSYTTNPSIYGNLVTYTDCGNDSSCGSGSTIYLYNITSGTRVPLSSGANDNDYSAIYGNRIVWQNTSSSTGISQIYINGTSASLATQINASVTDQMSPAIYGNLVTYADCGSDSSCRSGSTIYLFNITSGIGIPISSGSNLNTFPAIYNNRIVWLETSSPGNPYQILINGTALGDEYSLTPNEPNIIYQHPAISGNWVVWYRTNASYSNNNDLVVNDTSTNQQVPIALDRSSIMTPSISFSPIQSLYRIVWVDEDIDYNPNIYLYTSGSSVTCPVAGFTNDFAGGSAPVTVHFTDTASYSSLNPITHWFWDFGDGTNSTLENPGHLYSANGAYDVSLTVSNPYCRNAVTVTNNVVIGSPVANFTASPTTGMVNTVIAFTDTSLGTPMQWNWSWGDGTWTNGTIQNPTHSYTNPGSYSISLTASNKYGSDTKTISSYITVLTGANEFANTTINGITFQYPGGLQYLDFNYTTLPDWTFNPNSSVLDFSPPPDRGFHNISIYTTDPGGFRQFPGNTTIAGTISSVHLQTQEIIPKGFSASTGGPFCSVNYSINLPTYPENAILNTQVWEGATASDATAFGRIAVRNKFSGVNSTAYTIKIVKTNFPAGGTATLHMSLNASLVTSKPYGSNELFVERIADGGLYGEVLGTQYLYHNSYENLDYFEAESPHGLSTFGVSFLEGAGNLFQLVTMAVSSEVQERYAGSGSWSGSGTGPDTYVPTAVQTPAVPQATISPSYTGTIPNVALNAVPAPPAPTAVSMDVGIIGWLADTVIGHIYLFAAAAIVVVSLIYVRQRGRRFDPLG
jgi:PKD repeat protein